MGYAHIWGSPHLREWNGKVVLRLLHLVCDRELRTPLGCVLPHALGRGTPGDLYDSLSQAAPPPQGLGGISDAEQRCSKQQTGMWKLRRFIFPSIFCLDFSLYNITLNFRKDSFILSSSTIKNRLKAHKQTLTALRNGACSQDAVWQQVGLYQLLLRFSR